MNSLTVVSNAALTMSSREIAELVESRHDSVKRTVERLVERGVITLPPLVETSFKDASGKTQHTTEYRLCKRDSYVVVAQLSPEFTARLVDRWQELETKAAQPAIPQTLPEALRLAADLAEQKAEVERQKFALEEKVAEVTPKAEAFDLLSADSNALTVTQTAKVLGIKVSDLTRTMHAEGWVYRQNESWVAYRKHIENGNLQYKEAKYTDENGMARVKPYCHVTQKGLAKLALMVRKSA